MLFMGLIRHFYQLDINQRLLRVVRAVKTPFSLGNLQIQTASRHLKKAKS